MFAADLVGQGSWSQAALALLVLGAGAWFGRLYLWLGLRDVVNSLLGQHARRRKNLYLQGNFAPTHSYIHEEGLKVVGEVPKALNGAFVRVGPNPLLRPAGDYHWFDGDGMAHAVRFKDGQVSYCNRLLETPRMQQERNAGTPLFGKLGDARGLGGLAQMLLNNLAQLLRLYSTKHGTGAANTALVFHAKRILSLYEADLPFALTIACNGLVESIGRVLEGSVSHPFTAHPKKDPRTGELYFIGYQVDTAPYCWLGALDPEGQLMYDCPVPLPKGVMMHDMQLTEDYAIILDGCVEFAPEMMVKKDSLPFTFNTNRPSRFGIVDRRQPRGSRAEAKARWFELEPLTIFHTINAWQEGPLVRLFTCYLPQWDMARTAHDTLRTAELTFNLDTGEATKRDFALGVEAEFPKVPAHLQGRPTRYAYLADTDIGACAETATLVVQGIVKMDLTKPGDDSIVARISHGPSVRGGEAFFVPAHEDPAQCQGEDDGYLITFTHDESCSDPDQGSELRVYNAKTMSEEPVARIRMPQRVPYGFHSMHISEAEFQAQLQPSSLPGLYRTVKA